MWAYEHRLIELATAAANCMEQRAAELSPKRVTEPCHLQPCCTERAKDLAQEWEPSASVSTQRKLTLPTWPRVGKVDLVVTWPHATDVLLELKCGAGPDSLGPCVWDLAKCTSALQLNEGSAAYLLAGTTAACWNKPIRGAEFFTSRIWEMTDLRDRYADWWRQWERLGDPLPTQLPKQIRAEGIGAYPFVVGDVPWELRLARVEPAGSDWLEWVPLRPSG